MKKILILGASSMIGHQLYNFLKKKNLKVFGTLRENKKKNSFLYNYDPLKNFIKINQLVKKIKPDFIINTIGIIKYRKQIKNFENTIFLNSFFTHKLAQVCSKNNIRLIHLSTDCVFSGEKGNYSEKDIPDSTDLYGVSKKLGEINYQKCLTLRTSFIGFELENKTGLFEWILTNKNKTLSGFNKAFYNGFTTLELSKIILRLINLNLPIEGLYNLSSNKISKFSLLNLIIKNFKLDKKLIKNDTFYCDRTLNSKKFFKKIKYKVPNWNKMISDMKKLKNDIKK